MTVYTIMISEAQRALLAELLDKNRETIQLHQDAQAFGNVHEHNNLEPEALIQMFQQLPEAAAECPADCVHGFCL